MARPSWTNRSSSAALVATAVVMLSGVAAAEGSYASDIPNGGGCDTCHTTVPEVNDFGADMGGGQPDWSTLWNLDSDGDGQTNGAELGDPCGDWSAGDTPARTTDISNPGDSSDTSADPNTPACTTGSGGGPSGDGGASPGSGGSSAPGTGGDGTVGMAGDGAGGALGGDDGGDDGGCSCRTSAGSSGTQAVWAGLSALLALGWMRRRRHR